MKIFKVLRFYLLLIALVFSFWIVLALVTVLLGELTGVKPTMVILGISSTRLAYHIAWKLTNRTRGGSENK